jgi:hypothetical protein
VKRECLVNARVGRAKARTPNLGRPLGSFALRFGREIADFGPIFFAAIFVDSGSAAAVEEVAAVFLWAGDPVGFAALSIKIVRLGGGEFLELPAGGGHWKMDGREVGSGQREILETRARNGPG